MTDKTRWTLPQVRGKLAMVDRKMAKLEARCAKAALTRQACHQKLFSLPPDTKRPAVPPGKRPLCPLRPRVARFKALDPYGRPVSWGKALGRLLEAIREASALVAAEQAALDRAYDRIHRTAPRSPRQIVAFKPATSVFVTSTMAKRKENELEKRRQAGRTPA